MDRSFFNQPNDHCVNRLVQTSESRTIVATEDIYDQRGMKLLARGRPITASLQERLIARTLKKPLETCLSIEDGLQPNRLAEVAQQMFADHPTIAALAGSHQELIARRLGEQKLAGPTQLLMTAVAEKDPGSLLHAIINAAISASIALRLRLPETVVGGAITAGLLHDIGEFYVDPGSLGAERDLSFDQWKKVAVHPRIGALLLSEFSDCPSFIARAVQEHHERLDGSGYPAGLAGGATSELGQILMTAEVLAAILPRRQNPQASAMLAMRLVPGQFASQVVATLTSIYDERADSAPPPQDLAELTTAAHDIDDRLHCCNIEARRLGDDQGLSATHRQFAEQARVLCATLIASLHSTGVMSLLDHASADDTADPTIALELQVVIRELKWRMRALARHIALASDIGDRRDTPLSALVQKLFGNPPSAEASGAGQPAGASRSGNRAAA